MTDEFFMDVFFREVASSISTSVIGDTGKKKRDRQAGDRFLVALYP